MKIKKIVFTGGHHTCAMVVAEKLKEKDVEIIWFGHKYTMAGDYQTSAEYEEVKEAGFEFVNLKAGKFHRHLNIKNIFKIFSGFFQSFKLLLKHKPDLIFSFGGYLAVPVVICGWCLRIPSVTHEQTVVSGLANRVVFFFARKIFVSWPSSLKFLSSQKTVFTGLPLRKEILKVSEEKHLFAGQKRPTIYITGGKQGSHLINLAVKKCLLELLAEYNVIHQAGGNTLHRDFEKLKTYREELPLDLRKRYLVKDYFFKKEIGRVLFSADLVVGRSGAHIVYELLFLGKPALFIPIPWSYGNEQEENALVLTKLGMAEILHQKNLSSETLLSQIKKITTNLDQYKKAGVSGQKLAKDDAGQKMADLIFDL